MYIYVRIFVDLGNGYKFMDAMNLAIYTAVMSCFSYSSSMINC